MKIKSVEDQGNFLEIIKQYPPEVQNTAKELRSLLATIYPGITEVPWGKQKIIGYGVGPKKMSEHFCYIAPTKNKVNLGFMYGADLDDPEGLLEGTGKALRHIKVLEAKDVKKVGIKKLIKKASKHLPKMN